MVHDVPRSDGAAVSGDPRLIGLLRDAIEEVDAVSFDVLDTLYYRLASRPEDVFDVVGARNHIWGFRAHREQAQARAFQAMAQAGRSEIELDGIYACLPRLGSPAATLQADEEAVELAVLRLNSEVAALFAHARDRGKRVVLMSDMYLPQTFFQQLCVRDGLAPDHIFVSSACQATKRDHGALFDHVADALGLPPGRILHIGDNPLGDVARAAERGFRTFHYAPQQELPFQTGPTLDARLVQGVALAQAYSPRSQWRRLGFGYGGPAALAFLRFVEQRAREDDVDLVLNVARDGYTLHSMWSGAAAAPSVYFRTSRTALALAAIYDDTFDENLPFLLSGGDDLTLADVFARIGVERPAEEVLSDIGLSGGAVLSPATRDQFETVLRLWRFRILRVCNETRRGLHAYLHACGIKDGARVGFVDVGWSGTTQEAFARAIAPFMDLDVRGYYLCLRDDAATQLKRERLSMQAMVSTDTHPPERVQAIYANRVVFELFFSAPHASTLGYRLQPDGRVAFVEDPGRGADPRLPSIAAEIDGGARECAALLRQLEADLRVPIGQDALLAPLEQLALAPSPAQAAQLGGLYNFDAWGSSAGFQSFMARPLDPARLARGDAWPAGQAALGVLGGA